MNGEDWKDFLPKKEQELLAELLDSTKDYRAAYMQADDVKVAQLWTALIEFKKECHEVKEMIEKVVIPFKAIVEIGEVEKKRAIERVVRDILKPTEPEQEEATRKLVDSLMKF
jgi:5'-deoxynucleotidase YfbR-like HD superfamily hydrolase